MQNPTLRITEIFYSIQGESSFTGIPTVFIRLTGCPLRCQYCDTAYAFSGGELLSIESILDTTSQYNTQHVTVTGGEPLAQDNAPVLLNRLLKQGYTVSLETSGAIDISNISADVKKVMDFKTPGSDEVDKNRYTNIDYLSSNDEVKFVICDDNDYNWAKQLIDQYQLNKRCQILFSASSHQYPATRLADKILSDQLPVRFQVQLHKLLWNDAQGK